MAGKAKLPAPIDRPLSKAYLREFAGWSTAYPPGLSDPTSLRIMENIMITRSGAAAVRPALRSVLPKDEWLDWNHSSAMVGGFEHFFLNDGTKALLFAARQSDGLVTFRVAVAGADGRYTIKSLTDCGFTVSQGETLLAFSAKTTFVKYLQIDNKIFALSDGGEDLRIFNVGATKTARKVTSILVPEWSSAHAPDMRIPNTAWINSTQTTQPGAIATTTTTLISSDAAKNIYNYAYFYTFENEVGESMPSQMKQMRAQRGWSQWKFFAPNADGTPSTTPVTDPRKAVDQVVAIIPKAAFDQARAQGALKINMYMATWSDQEAVPPEAVLVGSRDLTEKNATHDSHGWVQHTAAIDVSTYAMPLPTEQNRVNYSDPTSASQGLVAGDRLVLVNDRRNGALIRWTSNQVGEYTNFSPSKGGGYKTLTSGNLYIPAAVKLWQNPQSVDTITILCSGVDGYSTAFYMAPAEVNGQSNGTMIMGFEETTATPGTVSPYGVEVLNNALYHPLDTELMKSTANNYNISHATMTEDIANQWTELLNKQNIISTQHDNRLYYLVHNPDGEPLADGCKGNEVWVYDAAKEAATWSRWLVQGIALSKLEVAGKLYVAVSRPESIYVFDPLKATDDVRSPNGTLQAPIPWKLETNTQGANRGHDAWAHVQQLTVTFGSFRGAVKYGIRGFDQYGRHIEKTKVYQREFVDDLASRPAPFDTEDMLQIRADMKEWYFFAESYTALKENGTGGRDPELQASYGAISNVQYRFTPVSVNVHGELGSVETFEYGRAAEGLPTNTNNGVPMPYLDQSR